MAIQKVQNYHGLIILVEAQLHDKVNLGNVKKTFK
jgi:hypothetical protein